MRHTCHLVPSSPVGSSRSTSPPLLLSGFTSKSTSGIEAINARDFSRRPGLTQEKGGLLGSGEKTVAREYQWEHSRSSQASDGLREVQFPGVLQRTVYFPARTEMKLILCTLNSPHLFFPSPTSAPIQVNTALQEYRD